MSDIDQRPKILDVLSAVWSAGGALWTVGIALIAITSWTLTTVGTVNARLLMIEASKVNETKVREIVGEHSAYSERSLGRIETSNRSILDRLRAIEQQVGRLSAIVDRDRKEWHREHGLIAPDEPDAAPAAASSPPSIGPS